MHHFFQNFLRGQKRSVIIAKHNILDFLESFSPLVFFLVKRTTKHNRITQFLENVGLYTGTIHKLLI